MKQRILVLYYTQTGQLRHVLDNVLTDIEGKAEISYAAIEPVTPFPFPWNPINFFDTMPETVIGTPVPIKPLPAEIVNGKYDLVILGYQPWFLHPSLPIISFLKGDDAKVLANKPVITVVGSRNMWLNAQEKVKAQLQNLNAKLVGNIVLTDTHANLVSLLTVIRWSFKGQKEASGVLPSAGIKEKDIRDAGKYGMPILAHLSDDNLIALQQELLALGAIKLKPALVMLEQRGVKNFRFWSKFIQEKGGPGDPKRKGRVVMFKNLLLVGIFILSPVTSVGAFVKLQIKKRALLRDVEYFKELPYEAGRI